MEKRTSLFYSLVQSRPNVRASSTNIVLSDRILKLKQLTAPLDSTLVSSIMSFQLTEPLRIGTTIYILAQDAASHQWCISHVHEHIASQLTSGLYACITWSVPKFHSKRSQSLVGRWFYRLIDTYSYVIIITSSASHACTTSLHTTVHCMLKRLNNIDTTVLNGRVQLVSTAAATWLISALVTQRITEFKNRHDSISLHMSMQRTQAKAEQASRHRARQISTMIIKSRHGNKKTDVSLPFKSRTSKILKRNYGTLCWTRGIIMQNYAELMKFASTYTR